MVKLMGLLALKYVVQKGTYRVCVGSIECAIHCTDIESPGAWLMRTLRNLVKFEHRPIGVSFCYNTVLQGMVRNRILFPPRIPLV